MKKLFIFLIILNFIFGFSQNLDLIKREVEQINKIKNFKIKTIPNDYFVDVKNEVTDNGQELKGYYNNNQLRKIQHTVGLSNWKVIYFYFFDKNENLIFINKKTIQNIKNGCLPFMKVLSDDRYYFNNNKLIKKIEEKKSENFDFIRLSNELKNDLKNYK